MRSVLQYLLIGLALVIAGVMVALLLPSSVAEHPKPAPAIATVRAYEPPPVPAASSPAPVTAAGIPVAPPGEALTARVSATQALPPASPGEPLTASVSAPQAPPPIPPSPSQLSAAEETPDIKIDSGGFVYEESLPHERGVPSRDTGASFIAGPPKGPTIAIIFDDLGLNQKGTAAAMALPAPLTLSFLPYAHNLKEQVAVGVQAGDTILLHMPMQPLGHDDPGPGALMVTLDAATIRARVEAALNAVPGAIGLNNHMGSKFTQDAQGLAPVFDALAARHLAFIDSRTIPTSVAYKQALAAGLPVAERDVFLDDVIERKAIDAQLQRLIQIARQRGSAIAIGHPYPPTIAALADWLPRLKAMGIRQVSVSELLRQKRLASESPAAAPIPLKKNPR